MGKKKNYRATPDLIKALLEPKTSPIQDGEATLEEGYKAAADISSEQWEEMMRKGGVHPEEPINDRRNQKKDDTGPQRG